MNKEKTIMGGCAPTVEQVKAAKNVIKTDIQIY